MLREVVADAIERMADVDERLRMATVTSVDTAPDLRQATVYLSTLAEDMALALDEHRIEIQRRISSEVRLKRTPLLGFAPDPAVAHGFKVEEILRQLHDEPAGGQISGHEEHDGPA